MTTWTSSPRDQVYLMSPREARKGVGFDVAGALGVDDESGEIRVVAEVIVELLVEGVVLSGLVALEGEDRADVHGGDGEERNT